MKTIRFLVEFFSDRRYKILLSAFLGRNVWLHENGEVTICFTEDDVETLKELPRLYHDVDKLNEDYRLARRAKKSLPGSQFDPEYT